MFNLSVTEDASEGPSSQLPNCEGQVVKISEEFDIHKYVGQELKYSKNPYYESSSDSNDLFSL